MKPTPRGRVLSIATLLTMAALPLAWLACGGAKPPETPADESSSSAESTEPIGSDIASSSAPASSGGDTSGSLTPDSSSATAAAAPPPAPPLGGTDCGRCLDKTCAKPAAACGKNTDCQATLDSIRSCGSDKGATECIAGATPPTGAKPKKLATAYETCAKKAAAKACKTKCQ